jgi:hypothetical protein
MYGLKKLFLLTLWLDKFDIIINMINIIICILNIIIFIVNNVFKNNYYCINFGQTSSYYY